MKSKSILRTALLSVVGISLVGWALQSFAPAPEPANQTSSGFAGTAVAPAKLVDRPNGVTAILFHGDKRCRTCIKISDLTRQTLQQQFAGELASGALHIAEVNYDEAGNQPYVSHYQLTSSTVVVTRWQAGRETSWVRLDEVWDRVDDVSKFRDLIAENVRTLLNR